MTPSLKPTGTVEVDLQVTAAAGKDSFPIPPETWSRWFHAWLEALSPTVPEADSYELALRLTDDSEIQALNAQYGQKSKPTDVLAFAALEAGFPIPASGEPLYLGDIVISLETAARQAQQQGHPLLPEVVWLASHGFLHLLGWDHPDEASLKKMLAQQETLLKRVVGDPPFRNLSIDTVIDDEIQF